MSKGADREWRFHLDDMINFAEKVIGTIGDVPRFYWKCH